MNPQVHDTGKRLQFGPRNHCPTFRHPYEKYTSRTSDDSFYLPSDINFDAFEKGGDGARKTRRHQLDDRLGAWKGMEQRNNFICQTFLTENPFFGSYYPAIRPRSVDEECHGSERSRSFSTDFDDTRTYKIYSDDSGCTEDQNSIAGSKYRRPDDIHHFHEHHHFFHDKIDEKSLPSYKYQLGKGKDPSAGPFADLNLSFLKKPIQESCLICQVDDDSWREGQKHVSRTSSSRSERRSSDNETYTVVCERCQKLLKEYPNARIVGHENISSRHSNDSCDRRTYITYGMHRAKPLKNFIAEPMGKLLSKAKKSEKKEDETKDAEGSEPVENARKSSHEGKKSKAGDSEMSKKTKKKKGEKLDLKQSLKRAGSQSAVYVCENCKSVIEEIPERVEELDAVSTGSVSSEDKSNEVAEKTRSKTKGGSATKSVGKGPAAVTKEPIVGGEKRSSYKSPKASSASKNTRQTSGGTEKKPSKMSTLSDKKKDSVQRASEASSTVGRKRSSSYEEGSIVEKKRSSTYSASRDRSLTEKKESYKSRRASSETSKRVGPAKKETGGSVSAKGSEGKKKNSESRESARSGKGEDSYKGKESSEGMKRSPKEESSGTVRRSATSGSSDAVRRSGKQKSGEGIGKSAKDESTETLRRSTKDESKDTIRRSAKGASSDATKKSAKEDSREKIRRSTKSGSNDVIRRSAKKESGEAVSADKKESASVASRRSSALDKQTSSIRKDAAISSGRISRDGSDTEKLDKQSPETRETSVQTVSHKSVSEGTEASKSSSTATKMVSRNASTFERKKSAGSSTVTKSRSTSTGANVPSARESVTPSRRATATKDAAVMTTASEEGEAEDPTAAEEAEDGSGGRRTGLQSEISVLKSQLDRLEAIHSSKGDTPEFASTGGHEAIDCPKHPIVVCTSTTYIMAKCGNDCGDKTALDGSARGLAQEASKEQPRDLSKEPSRETTRPSPASQSKQPTMQKVAEVTKPKCEYCNGLSRGGLSSERPRCCLISDYCSSKAALPRPNCQVVGARITRAINRVCQCPNREFLSRYCEVDGRAQSCDRGEHSRRRSLAAGKNQRPPKVKRSLPRAGVPGRGFSEQVASREALRVTSPIQRSFSDEAATRENLVSLQSHGTVEAHKMMEEKGDVSDGAKQREETVLRCDYSLKNSISDICEYKHSSLIRLIGKTGWVVYTRKLFVDPRFCRAGNDSLDRPLRFHGFVAYPPRSRFATKSTTTLKAAEDKAEESANNLVERKSLSDSSIYLPLTLRSLNHGRLLLCEGGAQPAHSSILLPDNVRILGRGVTDIRGRLIETRDKNNGTYQKKIYFAKSATFRRVAYDGDVFAPGKKSRSRRKTKRHSKQEKLLNALLGGGGGLPVLFEELKYPKTTRRTRRMSEVSVKYVFAERCVGDGEEKVVWSLDWCDTNAKKYVFGVSRCGKSCCRKEQFSMNDKNRKHKWDQSASLERSENVYRTQGDSPQNRCACCTCRPSHQCSAPCTEEVSGFRKLLKDIGITGFTLGFSRRNAYCRTSYPRTTTSGRFCDEGDSREIVKGIERRSDCCDCVKQLEQLIHQVGLPNQGTAPWKDSMEEVSELDSRKYGMVSGKMDPPSAMLDDISLQRKRISDCENLLKQFEEKLEDVRRQSEALACKCDGSAVCKCEDVACKCEGNGMCKCEDVVCKCEGNGMCKCEDVTCKCEGNGMCRCEDVTCKCEAGTGVCPCTDVACKCEDVVCKCSENAGYVEPRPSRAPSAQPFSVQTEQSLRSNYSQVSRRQPSGAQSQFTVPNDQSLRSNYSQVSRRQLSTAATASSMRSASRQTEPQSIQTNPSISRRQSSAPTSLLQQVPSPTLPPVEQQVSAPPPIMEEVQAPVAPPVLQQIPVPVLQPAPPPVVQQVPPQVLTQVVPPPPGPAPPMVNITLDRQIDPQPADNEFIGYDPRRPPLQVVIPPPIEPQPGYNNEFVRMDQLQGRRPPPMTLDDVNRPVDPRPCYDGVPPGYEPMPMGRRPPVRMVDDWRRNVPRTAIVKNATQMTSELFLLEDYDLESDSFIRDTDMDLAMDVGRRRRDGYHTHDCTSLPSRIELLNERRYCTCEKCANIHYIDRHYIPTECFKKMMQWQQDENMSMWSNLAREGNVTERVPYEMYDRSEAYERRAGYDRGLSQYGRGGATLPQEAFRSRKDEKFVTMCRRAPDDPALLICKQDSLSMLYRPKTNQGTSVAYRPNREEGTSPMMRRRRYDSVYKRTRDEATSMGGTPKEESAESNKTSGVKKEESEQAKERFLKQTDLEKSVSDGSKGSSSANGAKVGVCECDKMSAEEKCEETPGCECAAKGVKCADKRKQKRCTCGLKLRLIEDRLKALEAKKKSESATSSVRDKKTSSEESSGSSYAYQKKRPPEGSSKTSAESSATQKRESDSSITTEAEGKATSETTSATKSSSLEDIESETDSEVKAKLITCQNLNFFDGDDPNVKASCRCTEDKLCPLKDMRPEARGIAASKNILFVTNIELLRQWSGLYGHAEYTYCNSFWDVNEAALKNPVKINRDWRHVKTAFSSFLRSCKLRKQNLFKRRKKSYDDEDTEGSVASRSSASAASVDSFIDDCSRSSMPLRKRSFHIMAEGPRPIRHTGKKSERKKKKNRKGK